MSNDMTGEAMPNFAALRFRNGTTIEGYMASQTSGQIVGESIVVTKMVSSILDGISTEKGIQPEIQGIAKECTRMLGDVVKRLSEVASRIADIDQAQVDGAARMAKATANPEPPQDAVVIEDGFTGGYIITCPKGRIGICEHRVGPRVLPGYVEGLDRYAVTETAKAIAERFGWGLVDHTADGVLNPWHDVGGKEGDA